MYMLSYRRMGWSYHQKKSQVRNTSPVHLKRNICWNHGQIFPCLPIDSSDSAIMTESWHFINCEHNAGTSNQYSKIGPFWIILIIFHHKLMVVVWRIEVAKHCQCLNLGPTSPSSNHGHSPILVLDPVLAPTTTEGVGTIKSPGLVSKLLQIGSECPTQDVICLHQSQQEWKMTMEQVEIHSQQAPAWQRPDYSPSGIEGQKAWWCHRTTSQHGLVPGEGTSPHQHHLHTAAMSAILQFGMTCVLWA